MDNRELALLLTEAAELLDHEEETLTEGIDEFAPLIPLVAYLTAVIGLSVWANNAQIKAIAKNEAKAVTREEISEGVKFLNGLDEKIKLIFKQSKYKDFIDQNIIHLNKDFIDASKSKNIKHVPFTVKYELFRINMVKLAQLQDEYDKAVVTSDRLSDYLKKETENVAKVCDKVRDLVKTNNFFKEHFDVILMFNENQSVGMCCLVLKHPLILDTSKYLKGKK